MLKYLFFTKKGFVSYEVFPVLTIEFNMPFVHHRGTKTPMAVTQRDSAFPVINSYLFHLKNASGTSLLIFLH